MSNDPQTTRTAEEILDEINHNHMDALAGIITVDECDRRNIGIIKEEICKNQ